LTDQWLALPAGRNMSFRQIHDSPAMIFAFAGPSGLDFPTPTPVPTASAYKMQRNAH
jgi:hypothetical protein